MNTSADGARFVGQAIRRREDPRLLTGQGRYVDDVAVSGVLHIAFLRSDVAAGTIRSIDTTNAERLEGVHAVFTGADLNLISGPLWATTVGPQPNVVPLRPLADSDVRFVGDPIALVVANDRYIAEDACDLIEVDIDPTRVVATIDDALVDDAPVVHPELGTNLVVDNARVADAELDQILSDAPHVVTATFASSRLTNVPMEGRGIMASWGRHSEEFEVWASTQSPHEIKAFTGRVTGTPEHRVRVEFGDVGGGFGQKMFPGREEAAVLLAAKQLGRPVKWIEDRRENLIAANQARHDRATVTMALDTDGIILGATFDLLEDVGAYPSGGGSGTSSRLAALVFPGPYRIPKFGFGCRTVHTHTCGKAAYRGPWAIETVAREQMIDLAAAQLGIDPIELRRRNVIRSEDLPYTLPTGLVYDSVTPAETMELALAQVDLGALRSRQADIDGRAPLIGVGMSSFVEPSAVSMGGWATEQTTIRVDVSGTVEVLMGSGSHGHSLETTIPQVVADHLGCDFDDVVVRQGRDTPFGPGTGGSRSAVILGGAAQTAAAALRQKVVEIAAGLLEAAPADLEAHRSRISVRGTPARSITLADVARAAYLDVASLPTGMEPGLETTVRYRPPNMFTWSNACHLCVCEIDRDTGAIALRDYVVGEDCGVIINPMVVDGQIAGGVAQGIGQAMFEHMRYDEEANPMASTFMDYLIPTVAEIPEIRTVHLETPSSSVGGYKGMGEGGAIGSPPAVANAINDALRQVGAEPVLRMPITPEDVLESLISRRPSVITVAKEL